MREVVATGGERDGERPARPYDGHTMRSLCIPGAIVCWLAGPALAQPEPLPAPAPPEPGLEQTDAPASAPAPELVPVSMPMLTPMPARRDAPAPAPAGRPRRESTANLLTLGGVLLPVGLVIGAATSRDSPPRYVTLMPLAVVTTLFTPAAGHWYTGKVFTLGVGLRAAGGLLALAGAATSLSDCGDALGPQGGSCGPTAGLLLAVLGGATAFAGVVHDAVTAPRRVRQYNRAHGFGLALGLAPVIAPGATGLALTGRY